MRVLAGRVALEHVHRASRQCGRLAAPARRATAATTANPPAAAERDRLADEQPFAGRRHRVAETLRVLQRRDRSWVGWRRRARRRQRDRPGDGRNGQRSRQRPRGALPGEDVHRARSGADKEPRAIERQRRAELIVDRGVRTGQCRGLLPGRSGLPVHVHGARPELVRRFADEDLAVANQHGAAEADKHGVSRRGGCRRVGARDREERDGKDSGIDERSQDIAHGGQCTISS
jgi:hypothetical protein